MTWKTCAAAVREAAGRDLTDDQVSDIYERVQLRQKALAAEGRLDMLDTRLREAVAEDADALRVQAALAKKHAALSVIARDRVTRQVEGHIKAGMPYRRAVLAVFEGTTRGIEGARKSIGATKLAYEARYLGGMMARVVREVPHAEGMLRDRAFLDDVVREMWELREGGTPGATRNGDASKVARIFADSAEMSRLDLNRLGANIGKLDGWAGAQVHDGDRIGRAGRDAWISAVMPRLDLARTFPDLADEGAIRKALGRVWDSIVFQRERGEAPDPAGTGFRGPLNVARALERHRVLHFRGPDEWLAYSRDFGHGHIFDGMVAHQSRAALNASQMQVLGPNPGAVLQSVLDGLRRRVDADDGIAPEKKAGVKAALSDEAGTSIGSAFRIASGAAMIPASRTMAEIGGGIRAWQSLSKLGGAVISSISDLTTAIVNLRFNGMTFGEAAGGQIGGVLQGRGRGEQRELAYLLGEGFDGIIGHLTSPYVAADSAPGAMQSALTTFFRWSGLTWWTDANRAAAARVLSAHLGRQAARGFDELDARLQNVLRQHDIHAAQWDAIRTAGLREIEGRAYIVPEGIGDDAAELALRRYFADEAQSAVLEADAMTQRFTTAGTSRGTLVGEALRTVMQFKAFPIAFTGRALGRAWQGGEGGGNAGAAHIGTLIAGLTILGYAAMTAKDAIRGYEPREVLDEQGNPRFATILAAIVQGGGAGIYGDFLFGEVSRSGNSALENVAGPFLSDTARLINLLAKARDGEAKAGEALTAALSSTPFANLWYARPAVDWLALNELRETLSPGWLARQDQRRRAQFGQDPMLPPSDRMALDLF
ncbi:MAG: hypothetical protein K2X74_00510 [Acetobacteraceae bacterium]|nr:hypothetical protein [Acetobacteraceae bacterium]